MSPRCVGSSGGSCRGKVLNRAPNVISSNMIEVRVCSELVIRSMLAVAAVLLMRPVRRRSVSSGYSLIALLDGCSFSGSDCQRGLMLEIDLALVCFVLVDRSEV
jgi:hypothetical protein